MSFELVFHPFAEREIQDAYLQLAREAPASAVLWFNALEEAIGSLKSLPDRCPIAPESSYFTYEVRHLLFGKKGRRYRVLFIVVGDKVHVLHFRHWARRLLERDEIRAP